MNGEQLKLELVKREGTHIEGGYELKEPASVTAKLKVHGKAVTKKVLIARVWPRAYEATTGECRAFWPLFDCEAI